MLRIFAITLLMSSPLLVAQEPKLDAPAHWGGETIKLPPGFAPDMTWKGVEHIRFAPGMMKADSDTFFCYAFVFELKPQADLSEAVMKDEFLKYYRGLCKAVMGKGLGDVDPAKFTMELQRVKSDVQSPIEYTGTIDWVEPFATKKAQTLNLEIRTWSRGGQDYIFVCVSPQSRDAKIWKELHTIRDGFAKQ